PPSESTLPAHNGVRDFHALRGSELLAHGPPRIVDGGAQAGLARPARERPAMFDVTTGHRSEPDLLGRDPERERPAVMLDQHRAEPFERSQDRAMEHDRTMSLVVLSRVLHIEPLREREVALHRGELPQTTDRVAE